MKIIRRIDILITLFLFLLTGIMTSCAQSLDYVTLSIQKTAGFSIDGKGSAENWSLTEWITVPQRETTPRMERNPAVRPADPMPLEQLSTQAKILWSDTGIYFLFRNEDRVLQATMEEDFRELWWEDVIEVFLWPDSSDSTYFEYQLSPLNHELLIRITRDERGRSSWLPFSYSGNRRTRHETSVIGGEKRSGSAITEWTAEVFIPYQLLHPAKNIPPQKGEEWKVNLYRNDYDIGDRTRWEWQQVDGRNHDLERFGVIRFE